MDNRYNRQELISGWDQSKLARARIAIVGGGQLANFGAASLASLGIGNIEIYDSEKVDDGFLFFKASKNKSKARALDGIIEEINPEVRVTGISACFDDIRMTALMNKPDLILDLTNSSLSKDNVLRYGIKNKIPVLTASSDRDRAEFFLVRNEDEKTGAELTGYNGKKQGAVTSEVIAGVITEEVRKILMPIGDEVVVPKLSYSLGSARRFSNGSDENIRDYDLSKKRILIVGAGALGNFAALGAALSGIGQVDILDFDTVDATNLNRQLLFYDSVGRNKSEALSDKIRMISPKTQVRGIVGKLDENCDYFSNNTPDLILDCVDSFAARAYVNYFAVRNQIPLVSGGTDPKSGQVVAYVPRKTACLDCKLSVDKALAESLASSSCRFAPDPSVIMTNEVIGGMMVGEAIKILDGNYGTPVSRILKYDSLAKARGGLVGTLDPCSCTRPEIGLWLDGLRGGKDGI